MEGCFRQRQEVFYFTFATTHTMSIASVDITVQGKIRTLSRSLPCQRLLADLGPHEVDRYREEKAEGGPKRQRTRGFHPTFTRFVRPRSAARRDCCSRECCHSGLAGYRRSLDGGFHTQFTVHRAIIALSSMTGRSPPRSVSECLFQAAPRCEYHRFFRERAAPFQTGNSGRSPVTGVAFIEVLRANLSPPGN